MAAWNSSSLAASDSAGKGRNVGGLLRRSKQKIAEKKMFKNRKGKHGEDFQIGKKFRKHGKGVGSKGAFGGDMKSSAISPSVDEFDKMMSSVTNNPNKKKSMFSRKQFG